jgi:recombination protein RecT
MQCTKASVLRAVVTSLAMGFEPDNSSGLAYLVPYKDKKANKVICQLIVGYRGFVQLALRSDQVADLAVYPVFEGDEFDIDRGRAQRIIHRPLRSADERPLIAAYSCVTLIVGGVIVRNDGKDFMWRNELERHWHRYSPHWNNAGILKGEDSMVIYAQKTLARRTCKWLPSSPTLQRAVSIDEQADVGMPQALEVIDLDEPQQKTDEEIAATMRKESNETPSDRAGVSADVRS